MKKVYAAYCYTPALGTKRDRLTMVFSHSRLDAEIEKERMKFSDAKTVGMTVRAERPRIIAQHLLHKYPGAAYNVRHIAGV